MTSGGCLFVKAKKKKKDKPKSFLCPKGNRELTYMSISFCKNYGVFFLSFFKFSPYIIEVNHRFGTRRC